jgi:hypothetical protein
VATHAHSTTSTRTESALWGDGQERRSDLA